MINERKSKEEARERVGEAMLLSCLFLIGLSRDGDHNNSFVEEEEGGGRISVCECAHVRASVCVCMCVWSVQIEYCELVALGKQHGLVNSSADQRSACYDHMP